MPAPTPTPAPPSPPIMTPQTTTQQPEGGWTKQTELILQTMKYKDSSLPNLELQKELLRRLDNFKLERASEGGTWLSWLMYWSFLFCSVICLIGLVYSWWSGHLQIRSPIVPAS
eukprot:TRINITY_DN6792_c0_g1_i5.p1 TRINITY_DN6792_c0_g1~~TRINITY_DN6792_c0_g1_i5.p1  ORF type:complete len:114 (+),score=20.02 TRINITY_DN6792_c0_g1_i5:98-439(+)